MITFDKFIKKYPTIDKFEKDFPVGKKFKWIDRDTWKVVGYIIDEEFKNKDDFAHLVIIKSWNKYKQRLAYNVVNVFEFYSVWEMLKRESKN